MSLESLGKQVKIYSGDTIFEGKLIGLDEDSVVYEDEDGKHLLPSSEYSLIVFNRKNVTHKIKKEKDRIFLKFLIINSALFVVGVLVGMWMWEI